MAPSPRRRLRALAKRGRRPSPPLFVPLACGVAARTEGFEVYECLADATRLTKSLVTLHEALRIDGVTVFADDNAVAGALGARIEEATYPSPILAPGAYPQGAVERGAELVLAHPRIATALEVTHRVIHTLDDDPVIVAVLPGPLRLADTGFGERTAGTIEDAARILIALARAFCEAGAGLLCLREPDPPGAAIGDAWLGALRTIANVVSFYQALALIGPAEVSGPAGGRPPPEMPAGLLPIEPCEDGRATGEGGEILGLPAEPARWRVPAATFSVLTTLGEVPVGTDLNALREACVQVRQQLPGGSA